MSFAKCPDCVGKEPYEYCPSCWNWYTKFKRLELFKKQPKISFLRGYFHGK